MVVREEMEDRHDQSPRPPARRRRERSRLCGARGAARETRNDDGLTALDIVSGPWSEELRGLYEFLDAVFQMELDIERIRAIRSEVNAILRAAS